MCKYTFYLIIIDKVWIYEGNPRIFYVVIFKTWLKKKNLKNVKESSEHKIRIKEMKNVNVSNVN